MKKKSVIAALLSLVLLFMTACSSSSSSKAETPSNPSSQTSNTPSETSSDTPSETAKEPTVIRFGARQDYKGVSYIDDNGELTGYDIEIMRAIDEELEDYVFEYDPVGQETLLTGLETNQYVGAIGGFYWSQKRADAYLFPEVNIGAALVALQVRNEDVGKIVTLEDLYDSGGKLVPIAPTSGYYTIVTDYNKAHPDKQIELETIEWNSVSTEQISQWIHEGVYDAAVVEVISWDSAVKAGVNTNDTNIDIDHPFAYVKTWTLFAKGQEDFTAEYDRALKTLMDNGTVSEIFEKYNGFDFLSIG